MSARFDDPNLVSCGGLAAVLALATRVGLCELVSERLALAVTGGAHATAKIVSLVAGMVAGADSIEDMDLLRHGGMGRLFTDTRAPSTLGTFLRCFTFGHVRQLDAVAARLLARLAAATPILGGAEQVAFVDLDDTVGRTFGYAKQGAGRGYSGVKGLNALIATVSTHASAPVIAATRLRKGSTNSVRGAAKLLADALATARRAGATGRLVVRADSAFYGHDIVEACHRAGARFSLTARHTKTVHRAMAAIPDTAWVAIRYPNALYDESEQRWISDAEVAETTFTAFTGRRKALIATVSTHASAPVIAATRLRKGSTNSVRGAAKLLADALATARRAGATGRLVVRADSAFYGHDIVEACHRAGARFSLTARHTKTVHRAMAAIPDTAWVAIRYPNALYDESEQRWISDAEVAETTFTAFTGRRKAEHVTARLIVRRVRRLNPATRARGGQDELFAAYRYHAVFTDSPESMLTAEAQHRDHAIIEQVIADLKDSALAHLPSGVFTANAAWLASAAIAHNLTRAAGALAGSIHARARTGTIRARLIAAPARIAGSARRLDLHLPRDWPWEPGLDELFRRALHDPLPTTA